MTGHLTSQNNAKENPLNSRVFFDSSGVGSPVCVPQLIINHFAFRYRVQTKFNPKSENAEIPTIRRNVIDNADHGRAALAVKFVGPGELGPEPRDRQSSL
tara:strand:- start:834 stop:1133 length:300 start_codon:yes stop_codon:yes gene_type:complete